VLEFGDLPAVEQLFTRTEVYRRFHIFSGVISSLSSRDRPLDGSYCTRANEAIAVGKLGHNQIAPLPPAAGRQLKWAVAL